MICIVNGGAATSFTANDSMHSIQKMLQETLGIYDDSEIDFSRLNRETFNSYSSHAATAAAAHYENHAWNEAYVDGRWVIL